MISSKDVEVMIKSFDSQYNTLKEIAEYIKDNRETTKMIAKKNENILKEIKRDYESLGKRIAELESYAAMYNCWGYHD